MKFILFFIAVFLTTGFASMASANCMSGCLQEHGCDLEQEASHGVDAGSACMMSRDDCEARCHHSEQSYGAVAYGKASGAWGMSGSFSDKKSAAEDALTYCRENGKDCKVVMDLHEACAAVAEGDDDVVTWAKEATAAEAQEEAMKACNHRAGDTCGVELWRCYYP